MAALTRTNPQPPSTIAIPPCNRFAEKMVAGEDITIGDLVYIKNDGLVWKANGTALNAAARHRGAAFRTVKSGEPITFGFHVAMQYGTGLTPGADYYLGTTAGGLDTAATTGGLSPAAFALDATRIFILAPK